MSAAMLGELGALAPTGEAGRPAYAEVFDILQYLLHHSIAEFQALPLELLV